MNTITTIEQLGESLELPPPDGFDQFGKGNIRPMLDCPLDTECGAAMKITLRQAALLYHHCKDICGPDEKLKGISDAAWWTCRILFYG